MESDSAESSQTAAAMKVGDTVAAIGSMVHVVAYNGVITEQRLLGWTLNNESPVVAGMASASAQNVTNVFVSAEAAKACARNLISQQINSLTAQLLRVV